MSTSKSFSTLPDLDEIYKNLLNNFDPASKRLVQAGRELWRTWIAVTEATRVYAEALERLGLAGSNCPGETKDIGQCLLQISETLKELHKQEKNTIQFYESQVLMPTDANLDQDSKILVDQRKNFEKKLKQMGERVKRDKKKGVPIEESERMFRDYQADCVKQALTEEKKRYTYMLDRHCALVTCQMQFYRTALALYETSIQKWKDACANPEELSAAALAALDAAIQPYSTQSSISTVSRPAIQTSMNTQTDTVSNGSSATPKVREQGVGTFHINEGVTVKATLEAATIVLQNQQRQETVKNGVRNGQSMKTFSDPPSTGSSTLSNGSSRYINHGEPALNNRAISVSSLVKKTDSPTHSPASVSPSTRVLGNGNAEYAVAVKPNRKPETALKPEVAQTVAPVLVTKQASPPASERRRAVAMFTYNNTGSNQLAFQEGDPILVIQNGQQGWQFGENMTTGKRGWYPASFTKPESEVGNEDGPPQPRPRSQSSATAAMRNGGNNGYTSTNGGLKHSPSMTNTDGDQAINGQLSKPSQQQRPVSMMINPVTTSPTYRSGQQAPEPAITIGVMQDGTPIVYVDDQQSKGLHMINYDTVPKQNPFSHVRLRKVVRTDGTPKKYG